MRPVHRVLMPCRYVLYVVMLFATCATAAIAQATPAPALDRQLRVFFDCPGIRCDDDFLIEQIAWVDFVRDRAVADVHVLVTRQPTGGGGHEYTLRFIGREHFAGREFESTWAVPADATDDDRRRGLARAARLGLVGFASETAAGPHLDVSFATDGAAAAVTSADDPWNRWVFDLGLESWFDGESQYRSLNFHGRMGANRVTADWKLGLWLNGQNNSDRFEIDDSTTVESKRESYGVSGLSARALTTHWSAGLFGGWNRSTRSNYDASMRLGPAVEYSVFPYSESTGRLLTMLYAIGPRYYDYREVTIFGERSETLLQHFLVVSYEATQPWGSVDVSLQGEHFIAGLDEPAGWSEPQYSLSAGGGVEVRLVRGLSVEVHGSAQVVRNQIQLAAGDLTPEEILTAQRERATDYRYRGSFGLSYEFGSIYSRVVNPRLRYLD